MAKSDMAAFMKQSILSLTILTYLCMIGGGAMVAQDFFHQWRTGIVPPSIFGNLAIILIGVCCSVILGCVKALDTRLRQLEGNCSS
jgi:drug/metabolite transporter (DMT)-like permease